MDHTSENADIKPVRSISTIWLVPFVALSIGVWMIFYQWNNQGPLINIVFENASGLEAGKTKIKMHNVDVGQVKSIALTDDLNKVLITARMSSSAVNLLLENTQFWLVTPRISLNGVSGLGTLVSGTYINMSSSRDGKKTQDFVALPAPPITPAGTPGLHVTLNSNAEFAFKEGDPVIYKGLKVGEFESVYFNFKERVVYYNTFIEAPYHELITTNTKFWNTSGVQMELGADGVKVKSGSIETLLTNGVAFGVPEGMPLGAKIDKRSYFSIHESYDSAAEERYKLSAKFVVLVDDTVRGLQVGAPVEYRGIKVGKVLQINPPNLEQDSWLKEGYIIPVVITIQPGRVQHSDDEAGLAEIRKQLRTWVQQGLRASLQTGNLLTGSLFIDLAHYDDAKEPSHKSYMDYDVIPTISNEFTQITEKVAAILDKVNALDLKNLTTTANNMMTQINQSASAMGGTATKVDTLILSVEQQQIAAKLAGVLDSIATLSNDFAGGSDTHTQINKTFQVLQQRLNELQPLLLELNRSPNSLIFDNSSQPYIQPKAKPHKK
ncbi:MAG: paraquat-inducible protein B [Paraglaciecola sp.]|jgi:paraquat-inducible protein B